MIENAIQIICVYAIPLIFAITLHEAAHGWAAKKLGDDTAWILGRVTANPVPHIDPVGTVLVPGALVLMSALTGGAGFVFGQARADQSALLQALQPRHDAHGACGARLQPFAGDRLGRGAQARRDARDLRAVCDQRVRGRHLGQPDADGLQPHSDSAARRRPHPEGTSALERQESSGQDRALRHGDPRRADGGRRPRVLRSSLPRGGTLARRARAVTGGAMARNDYSECFTRPSPWVLCWKHLLPRQGEVLDVACGPGRHTALLALEGHRVLACDIDLTGVEALAELPNVTLECRDLEGEPWPWEAERFAGIVVTNYLHRPHFPYYWDSLMPGGVLIMETFTEANMMIWEHPRNPDHYLTEGELIRLAPADARVVAYEEGLTPADTCVARIVLMKHAPAECYAAPLEAGLGI